ncbi:MAG TPA: discoidin domain-containing protein [Candidatus Eisenbacteria bacterium]|jgi:hypothetical protein
MTRARPAAALALGTALALLAALACGARAAPAAAPAPSPAPGSGPRLLDDFEDLARWSVHPAAGVEAAIAPDSGLHGRALRLDVRFARGTGYAVVRRALDLELPSDYAFRLAVRGELPPNSLEFKLVDSSGANVWWFVRRDLAFPREWTSFATRRRQIRFAWGPAGGGEIRRAAFLELAVTAGEGGTGSVWFDDLTLERLEPDSTAPPPSASASSARPGQPATNAADRDTATGWASDLSDPRPWLTLDLGRAREIGGLVIDWGSGPPPNAYRLALSLDGAAWSPDQVRRVGRVRDPVYLPGSEARYVRLSAEGELSVREVAIQPFEWSETPEAFFEALAAEAPRGSFPRPYSREQCAWAVVGADGGRDEALLSADGMLETGKRRFSVEPFLEVDGRFYTWADVKAVPSLAEDRLPVPTVSWPLPEASLAITAFAHPDTDTAAVLVRYRLRNLAPRARRATLYLAARPFQVNPPWQTVGVAGGVAPIRRIGREGSEVRVDGEPAFVSLTPDAGFGATSFEEGDLVERLRERKLDAPEASDPSGFGSGALVYTLHLPPGAEREVDVRVPLGAGPGAARALGLAAGPAGVAALQRRAESAWRAKIDRVRIEGPPAARDALRTLEAQIGWILVNRDGPAIQPGSRSYDRSWIRDGSLTSIALLRLGHAEEVRDFIDWFAGFQDANGGIPCCASARGPDPVPENDSHGQFLMLIAEYHRTTGDRALVLRQWPRIRRAVAWLDSLRAQRRTEAWRAPGRRAFYGLLLPSISHEGYANPVHSYWDDFFGYAGYVAAVTLAGVAGEPLAARSFAAARDTFARDLAASVAAVMAERGIDYVPGSADLGDFDATSTTVALSPTGADALLPAAALRRTFERYWEFFEARRGGEAWDGFTPYETRVIGSLVRLGRRDRAYQALKFFLAHRLPAGWRQWPEIAYRDPRTPRFLGDLPHTWVGSDFARSVLDMIAYDRGRDSALVIGAGVPFEWIEGAGLSVRNLGTPWGPLTARFGAREGAIEVSIEPGLAVPPGGIVVLPPARARLRAVEIDGRPGRLTPEGGAIVRRVPVKLVFH